MLKPVYLCCVKFVHFMCVLSASQVFSLVMLSKSLE